MSDRISVRVADIIGSPVCISAEDGQKVFEKIVPLLKEGKKITLSFERVDILISLFLNVAIGQLYDTFSEEDIRALVKVAGLDDDDIEMLRRVVENAKRYYSNQKAYDAAWQLEGDEDEK